MDKLDLINDGLCNIRILNPKKLHLIKYVDELVSIGVSRLRLEFTNERKKEMLFYTLDEFQRFLSVETNVFQE